jgi:hypothetical protein
MNEGLWPPPFAADKAATAKRPGEKPAQRLQKPLWKRCAFQATSLSGLGSVTG